MVRNTLAAAGFFVVVDDLQSCLQCGLYAVSCVAESGSVLGVLLQTSRSDRMGYTVGKKEEDRYQTRLEGE